MKTTKAATAKDFSLGAMERHGDLNITRRHGAYIVIGFTPDGGHVNEGFKTLEMARGYAKGINRGEKTRKNPLSESGNLSKKGDRPGFWIDEDSFTIHTYKKNGQSAGSYEFNNLSTIRKVGKALEKEGYDRIPNPNKQAAEARKSLESFYARKNPRGSKDHWFYIDSEKMQIHTAAGGDHPSKTYNYEDEEEFLADIARFKADGYKFMKDQASRPRKFRVTRTNPVISLEEYQP